MNSMNILINERLNTTNKESLLPNVEPEKRIKKTLSTNRTHTNKYKKY